MPNEIDESQEARPHFPSQVTPIATLTCRAMGLGLATMLSMSTSIIGEVVAQSFLATIPDRGEKGSPFSAGALINAAKLFQVAASSLSFGLYPLIGGLAGTLKKKMESQSPPSVDELDAMRLQLYRWVHQSFISGFVSMIAMGLFFAFSGDIFHQAFFQPFDESMLAQRFLRCYLPGLPAFFYCGSMGSSLNALGFGKYVIPLNILSLIASALVTAAFTNGKWGAPALGVNGVAIGMGSRNWLNAIFYFLLSFKSSEIPLLQNFYKVHKISCQNNWAEMKFFLMYAAPIALRMGADFSINYVCVIFFGLLGSAALATGNVASQILSLTCLPALALGMAASKLVKEYLDAGKPKDAVRQGNLIIGMNFALSAIFCISGYFSSERIASFFLSDPKKISEAGRLLSLMLVVQLFDGIRTSAVNALSGISDLNIPTAMSVVSQVGIGLPLAYVLSEKIKLYGMDGVYGIPMGIIIGNAVAATSILFRWIYKKSLITTNPSIEDSSMIFRNTLETRRHSDAIHHQDDGYSLSVKN